MTNLNVFFNNTNLNSVFGVTFLKRQVHSIPQRQVNAPEFSNADGGKLVSADFGKREIIIEGAIAVSSRAVLEQSRDTLLNLLVATESPLEIDQSGVRRKYTATVSNIVFSEAKGGYTAFTITFICSDPFGYNILSTSIAMGAAITAFYAQKLFNILGSYYALPVLTFTFSSLSGATSKQVKISNGDTGDAIIVTRTWSNSDVLEIDCFNKTVKVNGTAVNYVGRFPKWSPGSNRMLIYEDTFTGRSVTVLFSYTQRWL